MRGKYSIRNIIPYAAFLIKRNLLSIITTFITKAQLFWWNIDYGKRCNFHGIPYMLKHPSGAIVIGDYCTFRSSEISNSIGINRRCYLSSDRSATLRIGNHTGMSGTTVAAKRSITIGNYVLIGANSTICDNDRHSVYDKYDRSKDIKMSPIVIEDYVWIGMNVFVSKGVTIGEGSVVASNSVVTHSIPANTIAGGIPAKIIRRNILIAK
jgi:acetyltransferase-like isoleucine patch superfamily enzyme